MIRYRFALGPALALALFACNRKEEVPASQTQTTSADLADRPAAEVPAGAPNADVPAPETAPEKGSSTVTTPSPAHGTRSGSPNWSSTAPSARGDAGAGVTREGTSPLGDVRGTTATPPSDRDRNGTNGAKGIPAPDPYGGVAPGHIMYPPDPRGVVKGTGEPNSAGSHNMGGAE